MSEDRDNNESRIARNYSPSIGEAVEDATKSGRVATREGATSGTDDGMPLPDAKAPDPQAQPRGPTVHDMDVVGTGQRDDVGAGGILGAGSATYARDVTTPAERDIDDDIRSERRNKETSDLRGARGAPGVGVPTGGAGNRGEISREKRKVVRQD